jgi:hypothetical protein
LAPPVPRAQWSARIPVENRILRPRRLLAELQALHVPGARVHRRTRSNAIPAAYCRCRARRSPTDAQRIAYRWVDCQSVLRQRFHWVFQAAQGQYPARRSRTDGQNIAHRPLQWPLPPSRRPARSTMPTGPARCSRRGPSCAPQLRSPQPNCIVVRKFANHVGFLVLVWMTALRGVLSKSGTPSSEKTRRTAVIVDRETLKRSASKVSD